MTLVLATLNVVRLPSQLVESIIALSIAFVAAEAFFGLWKQHRWKLAVGFGLIHGFGFANALTELELSGSSLAKALVGYNTGVELGQVAIVLVLAPLILWLRRQPRVGEIAIRGAAGVIFVAGSYWFIVRAFAG